MIINKFFILITPKMIKYMTDSRSYNCNSNREQSKIVILIFFRTRLIKN